ncbi:MAG TPA: aminotransferase class I/II-fold pyridoxal phosphate-dependent enzyme [Acidimicrobiia bacterium]|jgi:8-amino-7-oxononanoate synthase|nr:aminotransferase class I/II-fold pyridoxal phosphate-dependent enzyme [Acidimicrobiia bacterium]
MSFFGDRLRAYPRYELYRLGVDTGLYPYYRPVESASRPRLTVDGREVINFGSNNYLSLSYHPRVIEAAIAATRTFGTGVTGSRLLNGTLTLHQELEAELADFYEAPACLVFSTGYVANACAIAGFLDRHSVAIIDKEAHNSLLSGVRLSGSRMRRFRHNDMEHLAGVLASLPADQAKGVIVDGVYSMGGDTAPLPELVALCRATPNTFLLDDEAHGLGVLGARGRGALEDQGVLRDVDLVTVTFSKTLGSCGGAVLGPQDAIELLQLTAEPFIFTASNTPGSVAAALEALRVLREEPERPARLRDNVTLFLGLLAERGVPTNPADSAIVTIPLRRGDEVSVATVFRDLFAEGVFVNPVIPPAVAGEAGLIRLSLMVDHDAAMLEEASEALYKVIAEHDQL